jgi:hypothetical protein
MRQIEFFWRTDTIIFHIRNLLLPGRIVLSEENVFADYLAFYVERFNTAGIHRSSRMKNPIDCTAEFSSS